MSDTTTQIILAAVTASGAANTYETPGAYSAAVEQNAISIAAMLGEGSRIRKAVEAMSQRKPFVGTIVSIKREERSTRGVITLNTGQGNFAFKDAITGQELPAGFEQVRTERTDDPAGLAMAQKAQALVGHRVLVYVETETFANGTKKVKVLRHLEDLGVEEGQQQAAG